MQINIGRNPFDITDAEARAARDGITPNKALAELGLNTRAPIFLIVDEEALGRAEWDTPLDKKSHCTFVEIPQGADPFTFLLVMSLALSVGATIYSMSMAGATNSTDAGTTEDVYSFTSSRNRLRIGEPFAEPFGRVQIFPDLAQQSYMRNTNNEQYLYFYGFLGVGEYDVEAVYIDKTPIGDYSDSSYAILGPGESPSIIPDQVVWTSTEVGNQDLEADWAVFTISGPGTEAQFIEYDITFPGGLREIVQG